MVRFLVTVILTLALAACSTLKVYTDYNPAAQFTDYRTYSWRTKPDQVSPLMAERIVNAIDAQLRAKGWTEVPANPDVVLAANVATHREYDVDSFYGGPFWGGWGWGHPGWGWGAHGAYGNTYVRSYLVGTLAVDMFDARTRQPIWRGTAEDTIRRDPVRATADIQAAVSAMFATFPPGSAPAP